MGVMERSLRLSAVSSSLLAKSEMLMISFQNDILPLKNELFRLALRITQNRADAEDVVQDTMLKLWNRRDEWEQIDSIEAFSLTICRNLALDRVKRMDNQLRSTVLPSDETQDLSYSANPEQQTIGRDRLTLVNRLIAQLPEKQRTCMQLRDIEGKSYRDIAKILDMTEQQVKINIFRGRQTVKQNFFQIDL